MELALVRHALASIAATSDSVLLAGSDPLVHGQLEEIVASAHDYQLSVELLTPGVLLTPRMADELRAFGLARVRVAVHPERDGFHDGLRGASIALAAGLPVDLHLAVDAAAPGVATSLAELPIHRLILSDSDCRAPRPAISQWTATRVATALLEAALARAAAPLRMFLEGRAFHERMLVEVVEAVAGPELAGVCERQLAPCPVAP